MRAVVQRVTRSQVLVDGEVAGEINKGLMVLLGVEEGDSDADADYMAEKITGLRIFEDAGGKMNLSLFDVGGEMLVVSQFTLLGDCRKGKRPSFTCAAKPEEADRLYRLFVEACRNKGIHTEEGVFRAEMLVRIENHGPVTLILDSRKLF
ncbi:MAG: D-aminoacyl-tRNA deacylase [Bacillota bacterium]|jgi:D-tyrosyl-tRNA(Tyr) deacylase|nr:D-aminoacyl-tRNA deacylase [Bacillota bacterium]NLM07920.1 D-tyrosyl-tRNA(Tyr) deacylase [Clostridiales Family XIII bacterium]